MKCMLNKTLQFIYKKRKQIIFALFALIVSILDSSADGILKAAAPVIVAGAAASTGTAAAGAGTAVAGAGAAGAGTGAAGAAGAGAAGAGAGAAGAGTVGSKLATPAGGNAGKIVSNTSKNVNPNVTVPKNTNPTKTHSSTISSNSVNKGDLKGPVDGINEATSKSAKQNAKLSDVDKEKADSKKNRLSPELNSKKGNEDDNEEDEVMDSASEEITGKSNGLVVGCLFASIFLIIFSVPILILLFVTPTSSVMSQVDCSVYDGVNCVEDESSNFINKLKNLFSFGVFGSNSEVVIDKITDVYEKIKEEEDFVIDLPLLSSSLFADSEYVKNEVNENNQVVITDKMMERLEYVEDLARLQMIEDYVVYTCRVKIVDNREVYYKETNYDNIDPETVEELECDETTVNMVLKEKTAYFNEEEYFKRLEESIILDYVYIDFIDSDSLLISKIKNQYHLFNSINLINKNDEDKGTIPLTLMYDSYINLQSPLRGWYYITSPFGQREGEFAGMHSGIDLVANDKNIYAAGNGIVTRSNVELEGGNVIEITHTAENGVEYVSQYAHLSQRLVSVGDSVTSGEIIGIMGDTGIMASGVHLHFSLWRKSPRELYNPRNLFSGASNY